MPKSLLDTSTYFDMVAAPKHPKAAWAQNTSRHVLRYLSQYKQLTISALTIVETVDGFKRQGQNQEMAEFLSIVVPKYEVIYPDQGSMALAGEINAALAKAGKTIGIVDILIAATAITHKLTLVNANTKDFIRISDAGFGLTLENWRET